MVYEPTVWENSPSTKTPLTAVRLNKLELGVVEASTTAGHATAAAVSAAASAAEAADAADAAAASAASAAEAAVPTSGTTGQVLAKTSSADLDTAWVDPPSGAMPTREAAVITAATGAGAVSLAPAYTILSVTYSGPARLRLYRTSTGRDADIARPVATPYPGGRGRVYEYVATAAELDAEGSIAGSTATGSNVYYQVDAAAPVDITITYLRSE